MVGFDLDMTLVDSRPGIGAAWAVLAAETGVPIDIALVVSRLGPPLEIEVANWFPAAEVTAVAARYRELYPDHAVLGTDVLPGARAALAAVHRLGGRTMVVTGKHEPNARLHLDHLDLAVDHLVGDLWAEQKGAALRASGASVYVGDHLGDLAGARAAGAVAVGVATGPISAEDLRAAGADVVLTDLTEFPAWLEAHVADLRLAGLRERLRGLGSVAVAFSGGADSAFLLAAAVRTLGAANVLALTTESPSLPAAERDAARAFAADLRVRHELVPSDEMAREGYRANNGDRCRFCKTELMAVLAPVARAAGMAHLATGTNADDARVGFRPGIAAAAEAGAVTPLLDAGLTKAQVRAISRTWGLPTWDKPAAACLSSRVAFGVAITPSRLARVERAETALRAVLARDGIPVRNLRVRDLGQSARIEVDAALSAAVDGHEPALAAVHEAGFTSVEVDPLGYREGAMNELLPDPESYR
ncbi:MULTISPECIES: ATP-dependent sacrificial sulfur transferase LarE [unclassified Embleya]|uniref:ATP-dependent sacrificial sulfur transferase LarE n=1 Tax=unclassified Embleya TaxID=2699296 RepID=UPI0036992F4D